jgi:transposase
MTLNRLVVMHNEMLGKTLERGTMKNYKSTSIYIRNYLNLKYDAGDIYLKDLSHEFITGFEYYVRNNPLKTGDPCTNNGTMKHLERLKKMVNWACTNIFDMQKGVTLLHCMAHARRKFVEARSNDQARADYVLDQIQQLYAIERKAADEQLSEADILQLRQEKAKPILESLGKWMRQAYTELLPKSAIGMALAYSIQRWSRLMIYVTDGKLNIDNNPVENCIRPVAVGRKNYLFAGSHEAAQRSAMLYSLMATCKLHDINPFTWLKNVLEIIPTRSINKIHELLPHNWKPIN